MDVAGRVAPGQEVSVGAVGQTHGSVLKQPRVRWRLGRLQVPQLETWRAGGLAAGLPGRAQGRQAGAVRGEGHRVDRTRVIQDSRLPFGGYLPELNRLIFAAAGEPFAIRAPCQARNRVEVPPTTFGRRPGDRFQQVHGPVTAAEGEVPAVPA